MRRTVRFLPLAILASIAGSYAHAKEPPNVSAYLSAAPLASPAGAPAAASATGFAASVDPQRGVPTFFWAAPQKQILPPPLALARGPEDLARAYLEQNAKTYGLSRAALSTAYVKHVHDTGRGGVIVIFGQRVTPPGTVDAWRSFSLPSGTGYKVLKGQKLAFRYRITNLGNESFDTRGAASLLYFVPVEGN